MQKFRKSLSALLAIVMLISVFSFAASAGVDPIDSSATQNIAMKLEVEHADGTAATTVEPGETVTVNVYVTAKDAAARIAGGAIQFFWDSNVYTYVEGSRTWGLSSIDNASMYAVNNTQAQYTNTVAYMTDEEKAYGWNICGNFQISNSATADNTNASLIQAGSATPFISIKLKVSESVAEGTAAPIGIPVTSIAPKNNTRMNYTYIQTWTDAATTVTQNKSKSLYIMDTVADISVATVAAAGPVLTAAGRQIKMTLNEAGTDAVAGTEQLRVVSSFSAQDWNDYFVNTGKKDADGQPIKVKALKEVGIVASKGAFDLETAKGYAMQGKGEYGDYKVATTDYIQQTAEGLYRFGARIEYQTGVYDTTYIAFATYWDENSVEHTIFYGAQADIAYNTKHGDIVNAYILGLKK